MRVFYSAEEIEDLAAHGVTQLFLEEDAVLTDLAKDAVRRLGISLVYPSGSGPASPGASLSSDQQRKPSREAKVEFWARMASPDAGTPKWEASPATARQGGDGSLVDRAIDLVRKLASGKSGN